MMDLDSVCLSFSSPCLPLLSLCSCLPFPPSPWFWGSCACSMGPTEAPSSPEFPAFPVHPSSWCCLKAPAGTSFRPKVRGPRVLARWGHMLSASSSPDPVCPDCLCSTPGLRDIGDPQGGMLGVARAAPAARMGLSRAMATATVAAMGVLLPARVCALFPSSCPASCLVFL